MSGAGSNGQLLGEEATGYVQAVVMQTEYQFGRRLLKDLPSVELVADEQRVIHYHRRAAATGRVRYLIAVKTLTVLYVIRGLEVHIVVEERVNHQFRCIFHKDIHSVGGVLFRQSGTVETVCGVFVLPCEIILALRHKTTVHFGRRLFWLACSQGKQRV